MDIVVADIGGTHARFAIAVIEDARVVRVEGKTTLATHDYSDLAAAWNAFAAQLERPIPVHAAIAVAAPIEAEEIQFTNCHWRIRPSALANMLGLRRLTLINDFEAVARAVIELDDTRLPLIAGPPSPASQARVISIIGPGTGLGGAILWRRGALAHVIATEAGHIGFSPRGDLERAITQVLGARFDRVSAERIISGPGLLNIYNALITINGAAASIQDDKTLWTSALAGEDKLASRALDIFCAAYAAFAGDIALAHGADTIVLAGGLSLRLQDRLRAPSFAEAFAAKGRFHGHMSHIPVRLLDHPDPGLLGAASAYVANGGD